jgi:hypothetical protein
VHATDSLAASNFPDQPSATGFPFRNILTEPQRPPAFLFEKQ